ncbi:hypothetical protein CRM22_002152 [Opisthorchis felineus]|uniref:FERM domain-containing protein n=1 Tax=Opisthorchis felineus TaxID=147828 RepID=A0A4S2M7H5_OPIFE|nr:hypothetical protein CRM22_002152 [Opisthorchis felineus]
MVAQIGALVAQAELGDAPAEDELELSEASNTQRCQTIMNSETDTYNNVEVSGNHSQGGTTEPTTAIEYLRNFKIFSTQTPKNIIEIVKQHRKLRGLTAQEAESELLSRTSQLPTYGIDPFPVVPLHKVIMPASGTSNITESGDQTNSSSSPKSPSLTPVNLPKGIMFYLGITSTGLVTFVGLQRSQEYHWDRIQRMVCDGKDFLVFLKHDESSAKKRFLRNKTHHLTFECESKAAALAIWHWTMDRKCFFTLKQAGEAKRVRPSSSIFRRSHTYRFSGRSHQELSSIPIKNSSTEFIRASSLRRDGGFGNASLGHATLPTRIRPPLDLKEYRYNELVEVPADHNPVSETLRAGRTIDLFGVSASDVHAEKLGTVLIPDTVTESPTEEDVPTLTIINNQEIEPALESVCFSQPVEEPPIETKQVPQQASMPDPKIQENHDSCGEQSALGIRNRIDSTLIQSVVYQQVVSEFDHTVDTHLDRFAPSGDPKLTPSSNGVSPNNGSASMIRNGPVSKKASDFSDSSVDDTSEPRYSLTETGKYFDSGIAVKATTVTVVAMIVFTGLIVLMETNPSSESTVVYTLRNNAMISSFDTYIYTPVRNVIAAGLSLLWS